MARQPANPRKSATSATPRTRKSPAKSTITRTRKPSTPTTAPTTTPGFLITQAKVKFTLFNFLGKERAHYLVERVNFERSANDVPDQSVAHSIVIIDRSGSMTYDIEALKETLIKLLTIEEYHSFNLLVTLLSYSSEGDLQCHFQRAPIQEIMGRDSRQLQEIRRIRTTGCTCISQALRMASSLVRPGELTAITLHSDGYANDRSATSEAKELDRICQELQGKEVFVNTIAYSNSSDFRLLAKVANSVSGSCLKAGNIKAVYEAINNTSKLLGGSVAPPIEEPLGPDHDYQVFVSHRAGKLLGAAGPLFIRGLKADDDAVVFKYRKLTPQEYARLSDVPEAQTSEAVFAFARANLAEGNLNTAKYALASTFDATLTERHARALTNLEVAEMAQDLDAVLFNPGILQEHEILDHVQVNNRLPLLALMRLLGEQRNAFTINLKKLQQNYRRRGLKRIEGSRDENGNLVKPWLRTEYSDGAEYVPIQSFDINRNTASLNMLISRRVQLVPADGGAPIKEVAGISLDQLSTFNNYTVVSDGELNIPSLQIRISQKKLFDQLQKEGVLFLDGRPVTSFDPSTEYTLRLDNLPLVPPFEGKVDLEELFRDLAEVKVLTSLLAAHLKEDSDIYTPEQVEELKKHYLSRSLFLSFPTTNEYTDLQKALSEGSVDSRVSYKVDVGDREILNLGKLMSANKFLDRMYELSDPNGQKVDKPTCELLLDERIGVKPKVLSARTKVTKVDEFMKCLYDDFLGLTKKGTVATILKRVGDERLAGVLEQRHKGAGPARTEYVAALSAARKKLEGYADALFESKISPLVFYIGATGLLPDEMECRAQSAEKLAEKYPTLSFSKDEQEGTFYELGNAILSIYAKTEYFTVTREPAVAPALV